MAETSTSDSTGSKPGAHHDDEGRGDNPGVGGVPAKGGETEPRIDHEEQEKDRSPGDNPGVGGCPDDEENPATERRSR